MLSRLRMVCQMIGQVTFEDFPWNRIRYEHVTAIRSKLLEEGKSPATVNATLSAIKGAVRSAFNLGQMTADDYQRVCSVKSAKGSRLPAGRSLTPGELRSLFLACGNDGTPAGIRDAAILSLLYGAGLRRAEVAGLDLSDFNQETGELRILGKGNKERLVYTDNGSLDALLGWIKVRGDEPGLLLCPVNKGGKVTHRKMTEQTVYNVVQKRCKEAKVNPCSPHDFRRSFVSDLLDAGVDIVTTQHMAGHANVTTTARYDRRGEEAKKKAAKVLHVPYIKPQV